MSEYIKEEFEMQSSVNFVTGLPFGHGKIGAANALHGPEEKTDFAAALHTNTVPLTILNTADCVDERRTIALGNGMDDPQILENRIVAQVPGGLGLHVTKAAVGADLAILRDAADFTEAYIFINKLLDALGYEDGGHKGCGASKLVEESVADEIAPESLLSTLPVLTTTDSKTAGLLELNRASKRRRLEDGFFGKWNAAWHEGFLADTVPDNFSILAADPDDHETHGHHGSGAYVISADGYGFAKNKFIRQTGQEAFATTISVSPQLTDEIIRKIGGSHEERARLRLEFGVDAPQVLNQLVVTNFPVFAQAS